MTIKLFSSGLFLQPANPNLFSRNGRSSRVCLSKQSLIAFLFALLASGSAMGQTDWPNLIQDDIAQFKPTKQSSTFEAGHANRAVDGNTDGNWWSRSVSHTNETPNPWWEVNLLQPYDISSITIYNRTDCCQERLNNFTIRVSSAPFTSNNDGEIFVDRVATFQGNKTFTNNKKGQYIRIYLNQSGFMSLAEVVVKGQISKVQNEQHEWVTPPPPTGTNLALGKRARQSSTFDFCAANRANDGDTNSRLDGGSIAHTEANDQSFWEVDLGEKCLVEGVKLYNRTDCCQDRLDNFNIWVTDKLLEDMTIQTGPFAENEKKFDGLSKLYSNKKIGRYVRIQLNGHNNLNLAEVQVFGNEIGEVTISDPSTAVLYKVSVFRNLTNQESLIESRTVKSIEEGMDFSRKVQDSHKDYWSLSATAKVSAKYGVVDFEASVTAGGGGETTHTSEVGSNQQLKESEMEETKIPQKIPANSVGYLFRKFVINQSAVTYEFNGDKYSWYRINKEATAEDDYTVFILPANSALNQNLKMTADNWMAGDDFNTLKNSWASFRK